MKESVLMLAESHFVLLLDMSQSVHMIQAGLSQEVSALPDDKKWHAPSMQRLIDGHAAGHDGR